MEQTPLVHVTFGVEASQCEPHVADLHDAGRYAIVLGTWLGVGSVYLRGTAEEFVALADKLQAIATAHETDTHPVGEAAREVVDSTTAASTYADDDLSPKAVAYQMHNRLGVWAPGYTDERFAGLQ